jgi:thiol-disulfide isomerase/thioredoxin
MAPNDDPDLQRWVDDRLDTLAPDVDWDPNVSRGLHRLRSETSRPPRRRWLRVAATAAAAGLLIAPTPAVRGFAHKCGELIARTLPGGTASRTGARASLRPPVPDFTFSDESGRPVALSAFRGKVVLLTFWTTTCGQCQAEIPWFAEFQRTYRSRELVVLGVSLDEGGWARVKPYLERQPIDYRVVVGDRDLARPTVGSSIPTTLILDRDGRIAIRHVGYCSKAEYEADIQTLLAES